MTVIAALLVDSLSKRPLWPVACGTALPRDVAHRRPQLGAAAQRREWLPPARLQNASRLLLVASALEIDVPSLTSDMQLTLAALLILSLIGCDKVNDRVVALPTAPTPP